MEFEVYVKAKNDVDLTLVCLYVDNLLVTGSDHLEIEEFKGRMKFEFEMTDLEVLNYFLGLECVYTKIDIFLHQKRYTQEVFRRFQVENCNEAVTLVEAKLKLIKREDEKAVDGTLFKQIVGSLRFLCNNRPDISFGVCLVSRFMSDPRVSHMVAAKRIQRYLKGR